MTAEIGRRRVLTGTAGLGLATPLLAACGGGESVSAGSTGSSGGGSLVPTSDVPVGGGAVIDDQKVVVTQPTEGDFKAFSAVCTHQGCLVGKVEKGEILCPCHGSAFSAEDGSVVTGPATAPLEEVEITVKGDQVTLA